MHPLYKTLFLLFVPTGLLLGQDDVLIHWETHQLSDQFYSEGATTGDFNHDGVHDIASGPFWYAGPEFSERHQFYAQDAFDPLGYSNNFFAYAEDFNGDGWDDILVLGFPGRDASWFENPQGAERFWPRHQVLDQVDNESPVFTDITGDGRREIVCSSAGYFGYAEVNRESPESAWSFTRISNQSAGGKFTHGLGVGDVNGDGRLDLLEKSGWWQQPAEPDSTTVWKKHAFAFADSRGSAQMFAYDVDGDGDSDIVTSLNAHGYGLAWFEQKGPNEFIKHLIMGSRPSENPYGVVFSQLHAVALADIDGDGLKDIVTGKRWWAHGPRGDAQPDASPVLYWFRLTRTAGLTDTVRWIPHKIDDDSGVGVDVRVSDVDRDGHPDVVVGNKRGTFVSFQRRPPSTTDMVRRAEPLDVSSLARPKSKGLPKNEGLAPEQAAKAMSLPEGFSVQLAAGEPMVHQPIAMAMDERGRLWIAEAHTYPTRAPEGEGKDRIIILEDSDRDGTMDHRKVFIEGLNLVSGLEIGFGGVWVGAAPYLMFIPDRDHDDQPDSEPEILLDGFGYQDTHEVLNSFIWGPDGWLYGCHGVFTYSHVGRPGTPDAERVPLNCCVWRYHPVRHEFDVFARGTSNPWGVDFNEYGQAFITACVIPHMYHMIQGGRYQRQGGQHLNPYVFEDIKTIADHSHFVGDIREHAWWGRDHAASHNDTHAAGGGHAHCGAMIYLGHNWPQQYRGSILMANVHGNRINNDFLRRRGSGYVASHGPDMMFANDRWFRAINMKYAADGSVYLIDWYDRNACHRGDQEIWDRSNGRVYRISFGQCDAPVVDFNKASSHELAMMHVHPNAYYSRMARRILQHRFASGQAGTRPDRSRTIDVLRQMTFDGSVENRLRALWTLHTIGELTEPERLRLLDATGHRSEYLRAWAIQLELEDRMASESVRQRLSKMARSDASKLVRLYLAAALQRLPLDQRTQIARGLLSHGDDSEDHNLPLMTWYGVEPLVAHDTAGALSLADESQIAKVRQFIYRRAAASGDSIGPLLTAIGHTEDLERQKAMLAEVVAALSQQGRLKMPSRWPEVYAKLSASGDAQLREHAMLVTVKFGDASIFPTLRSIANDPAAGRAQRRGALGALVAGKDSELAPTLIRLLDDPDLKTDAIRSTAQFSDLHLAEALILKYETFDGEQRSDAIAALASRGPWARKLLDAVAESKIDRRDLSAVTITQIRSLGDASLTRQAAEVWGAIRSSTAEKSQHIANWKKRLSADVIAQANRSHGRLVYNNTCGKCHRLFGEGGQIGPDITGSNRRDLDYTLQNILDPNALIGKDYQTTTVSTIDGRVINGLIQEENETAVIIQTINERVVVDRNDIESRRQTATSMMPEGQLDQLKPDEARDLIAYLASETQIPLPGEGPIMDPRSGRVDGAIEGETMRVIEKTGNAASQAMGGFQAGRWSEGKHLWWTGAKPGDHLKLALVASKAGNYEVLVGMTKARDYGIVRWSINGISTRGDYDLYDPEVIDTGPVSLGTHHLKEGDNLIQVTIAGANEKAAKSYMFGLDYVYLKESPPKQTR